MATETPGSPTYSSWLQENCTGEWDMKIDHPNPDGETITFSFQRPDDFEKFKTLLLGTKEP